MGEGEVVTNRFREICEQYLREIDLRVHRKVRDL